MCVFYDVIWKPVLLALLVFSILVLLLRVRAAGRGKQGAFAVPPRWLILLYFWGSGVVAVTMLGLMVLGFVCVGSPGDIRGIIPD